MTFTELYERLKDEDFRNPATGNLFSNAYLFLYEPDKEYELRQEIVVIKERLIRPDIYVDALILDLFELFCEYLKGKTFGQKTMYDFLLEKESQTPEKVYETLHREAKSEGYLSYVNQQIATHFMDEDYQTKKVYVIIHGLGSIYPYLRASKFLSTFEKYFIGAKYKLILVYPGELNDNYSMFNLLNDEHPYRAIQLIN